MTGKDKTYMENTSADAAVVAFDYQYYFFLWKLLSLNLGETVGFEVKDDVHTELNDDKQILYQLKHTLQKKSDNESHINLTTSDVDLWKTLSNWSKVITDKHDGRETKNEQLVFLKKTSFVLASNKSSNEKNKVTNAINNFKKSEISLMELKKIILKINSESKDDAIKEYINNVMSLEDEVLSEFIGNVFFELDEDDIIKKCKDSLLSDKIEKEYIDSVFRNLDSAIKQDNYIQIKNGKKLTIRFEDYYQKYRRYYTVTREKRLVISDTIGIDKPIKDLNNQIFIKQLIEINDVDSSDTEEIIQLTLFKIKLINNLEQWLHEGEITSEEINSFKRDSILRWRNKYKSRYRSIDKCSNEEELNEVALSILDDIREIELSILGQDIGIEMCNGNFYELSNIPEIG